MKRVNFFMIARFLIGAMFVVSGTEKLLVPYQNFLYAIQGFEVLPFPILEEVAARVFPWLEVVVGGFLILGMWLKFDLFCVLMFSSVFTVIVARALMMNLPVSDCGCFGDIIYLPLSVTLSIDILTVVSCVFCLIFINKTSSMSMDNIFTL